MGDDRADGEKKKDRVNRGKIRKEVCNKREKKDWWHDGEIGKGKHEEAWAEKYFLNHKSDSE